MLSIPVSAHQRDEVKEALLSWLRDDVPSATEDLPPYLKNKYAQLLVSIMVVEFPDSWCAPD